MKIEKAIELSKEAEQTLRQNKFHYHAYAVSLGTAALARIRFQRLKPTVPHKTLLPGETKS